MNTKCKYLGGLLLLAASVGCATVTVKQEKPIEINVRLDIYEHAEEVVDELTTPLPKKDKPRSALAPVAPILVAGPYVGGAQRSLDEIKTSIRSRAEKVRALKDAGAIGEKGDAYLAVVDDGKAGDAPAVVAAENADRKALYETEATASGKALNVVQDAYANAWRKSAKPGDWIEQDGKWVKK